MMGEGEECSHAIAHASGTTFALSSLGVMFFRRGERMAVRRNNELSG